MALARTGTTRDWADIASDLRLPASHANQVDGFLVDAQRAGTWPVILRGRERLLTSLQQHPPPVSYQAAAVSATIST